MFVAGTGRAAVVVWIGGREFRLFWEPRDERFIREQMLPQLADFWGRVQDGNPPEPANLTEVAEVYPTDPGTTVELPETAFEALERITVLNSDITAQEKERDALKVALSEFVQSAETLTYSGRTRRDVEDPEGTHASFDKRTFETDHPDLAAAYTNQGAPLQGAAPPEGEVMTDLSAAAVAVKKNPTMKELVEMQMPAIERQLGGAMNSDAFVRAVLSEITKQPKLMSADPKTVLGGVMLAAQLRLEIGSGLGSSTSPPARTTAATSACPSSATRAT
jgi:hypothetical protein